MTRRFWVFGLLGWLISCMSALFGAEETNLLTVRLSLQDGFVRVDKAGSHLALRSDHAKWFNISSNDMHRELTGYLDGVFKKRGKLVEQLFTEEASALWKKGLLEPKRLEGWDRITGKWDPEFVGKLNTWIGKHRDLVAGEAKQIYDGLLGLNLEKPLDPGYEFTPLAPVPGLLEDSSAMQAIGLIQYSVSSPITPAYVSPQGIRPRERLAEGGSWPGSITSTHLSRTLRRLEGQLWFRRKIERPLTDYLESRGIPVEIEPPNSRQGPEDRAGLLMERPVLSPQGKVSHNRILFSHDPLLAGIFVRVSPENTNALRKALYLVLPSDDFDLISGHLSDPRYFQPMVDPFNTTSERTNFMVHLDLRESPGSALRSGQVYITGSYLAERLRYLEIAGFSAERWNGTNITTSATNRYKTVELVIAPTAQTTPERNGNGIQFVSGDITDLPSLAGKLNQKIDLVSEYVASHLDQGTLSMLESYAPNGANASNLIAALVGDLNRILKRPDLFVSNRFEGVRLRKETQELLRQSNLLAGTNVPAFQLQGDRLAYLNRQLIQDAYPRELAADRLSLLHFSRGTNEVQPSSFESEFSKRAEGIRRVTYEPEFPNFFRVGTEYSPKQPLRYYAGYTRTGVADGPNTVSGQFGWQDGALGEAGYTRDFFLFDSLERRLQVSLRGFSDYQPERLLAGQEVDERRTGGDAAFNLDLIRDRNAHWLRLDLAAGYREVTLDRSGKRVNGDGLTTVDLGLLYLYHWNATPGAARLELQPNVRLGYGRDRRDPFVRPSLGATYHRFLGSFWQWDCNGSASWASAGTPATEVPALGGDSTVRGYRADSGLGRASWAIQNELWWPLRYQFGWPETVDRIVRRNLAVATFVDVGGIHQSLDSFSGIKAGAGLGLRFVYNDALTLRADWAHSLEDSHPERGGNMFYFSVTTRRGF